MYRALEDERFSEFKSESHSERSRRGKANKSRCHMTPTKISEQPQEPTTTTPLPQQHPVYTLERKPEEQLPQYILDARKAIDNSNNIQSLIGLLLQKLTGPSDSECLKISDNLEKAKFTRWKLLTE